MTPAPSPLIVWPLGVSMSASCTLPLKLAPPGPILTFTAAENDVSLVFSNDWQPGMLALRTSGSLSIAHTLGRSAGNVTSPVIVIAIGVSSPGHGAGIAPKGLSKRLSPISTSRYFQTSPVLHF